MINHPNDLNIDQKKMIGEQYRLLKADHDKVKKLRGGLKVFAK